MKYIKTFETSSIYPSLTKSTSERIFKKYIFDSEKSVIIKRFEKDESPELILINIMKHSFLGEDGVLYGARLVKSYKDNKASTAHQFQQEVIYPTDIILYETDNLKDGLKELEKIKDIESKTNKYNL